jgi:hypothetical protein
MIRKWYEVSCDTCGCAEHFGGSIASARRQAVGTGWLIIGKNAFCTKDCKDRHAKTLTPPINQ